MAIKYINGASASDPIIKAIEKELRSLHAIAGNLDNDGSYQDLVIVSAKIYTLEKVYAQFIDGADDESPYPSAESSAL